MSTRDGIPVAVLLRASLENWLSSSQDDFAQAAEAHDFPQTHLIAES